MRTSHQNILFVSLLLLAWSAFPVDATGEKVAAQAPSPNRILSTTEYGRRMRGGWSGQMVGVGWGLPTEFKYPSQIVPSANVPVWKPDTVNQQFNDDIFLNVRALQLLDAVPLSSSPQEIAIAVLNRHQRADGYLAWGRKGIAPPDLMRKPYISSSKWWVSGLHMFPEFAGLTAPGMPWRAVEVVNNYTFKGYETLYYGRLIAAMNAEAFFESDIEALINTSLKVVPADSQLAEAVRDVVRWHRENPSDWEATWHRIQAKYFDNPEYMHGADKGPGTVNATVHIAYVVLGLLYGQSDFARSMELTMRCGQDSDCSTSDVGGILGIMLGEDKIPENFRSALDMKRTFEQISKPWSMSEVFDACERVAARTVLHCGGQIAPGTSGIWRIRDTVGVPGPYERWWAPSEPVVSRFSPEQMRQIELVALSWALPELYPDWSLENAAWSSALAWQLRERQRVLIMDPKDAKSAAVLRGRVLVPAQGPARMRLEAGSLEHWSLLIQVADQKVSNLETGGKEPFWRLLEMDLSAWRGGAVTILIRATPPTTQQNGAKSVQDSGIYLNGLELVK